MTTSTLELILEALEHSTPKMSHYDEPVARHERAINAVRLELELRNLAEPIPVVGECHGHKERNS